MRLGVFHGEQTRIQGTCGRTNSGACRTWILAKRQHCWSGSQRTTRYSSGVLRHLRDRRLATAKTWEEFANELGRTADAGHRTTSGRLWEAAIGIAEIVEADRLEFANKLRQHIRGTAVVLPLTVEIVLDGYEVRERLGLEPEDAVILATILQDATALVDPKFLVTYDRAFRVTAAVM